MKIYRSIKAAGRGIILAAALSSALMLSAAEANKTIELNINSSHELILIQNLAGNITVRPSSDNQLHIKGVVRAEADSDKEANKLLNAIEFDTDNKSGKKIISVVYPVDDYSGFIYNPSKKNSFWSNNYSNYTKYMGERVRVASKPKGFFSNWANVYTDLNIEIPSEQLTKIKLVAGAIDARDLNTYITLDTSSGKITVTNSQGALLADTGSGHIRVENFAGDVSADTGSGGVELTNIKGDIDADTGSGSITIDTVTGRVKADTGSGSVKVHNYLGGELLEIDTGSGSVRVDGDLGNLNDLLIDTGSGSVRLVTTHVPSLRLDIDTGSGGIDVNLPNMQVRRDKHGSFEASVAGGHGHAKISTGSGGVSFNMDGSYDPSSYASTKQSTRDRDIPATAPVVENFAGKNNPALAAKVRNALNKDPDIRAADLDISAIGDRVIINGTVNSLWDIAKAAKIIKELDGVKKASINLDLEEDD